MTTVRRFLPVCVLLMLLAALTVGHAQSTPVAPPPTPTVATFQQRLLALFEDRAVFEVVFVMPLDGEVLAWRVDGEDVALDAVGAELVCFRAPADDVPSVRCTPFANVLYLIIPQHNVPAAAWPNDAEHRAARVHITRFDTFADVWAFLSPPAPTPRPVAAVRLNIPTDPDDRDLWLGTFPINVYNTDNIYAQLNLPRARPYGTCLELTLWWRDLARVPCVTAREIVELRWEVPLPDGVLPTPSPAP